MQNRSLFDYFTVLLKGVAMGAADVVPGVSGGTIAFISGIYEELLNAISAINMRLFSVFKKDGFAAVWKKVNGNFLIALLSGIAISVVSLAKGISWLLEEHPILVWSFFFGLVLASILFIGKQITTWSIATLIALVVSVILAYYITTLEPLISESTSSIFMFLAGALAICAMILPGISGAFILVLLGAYKPVLEAIHSRDFKTIALVGLGAIVGLLTFSKLLKWLFDHHKNLTLAALTGFVIGSLNKIWPWKQTLTWRLNSHGVKVPFNEQSVLPSQFHGDAQFLTAIFLAVIGFAFILGLEKIATFKKSHG